METDMLLIMDDPSCEHTINWMLFMNNWKINFKHYSTIDRDILTVCKIDKIDCEIDESEGINAKILDYKWRIGVAMKPRPTSCAVATEKSPVSVTTSSLMSAPVKFIRE